MSRFSIFSLGALSLGIMLTASPFASANSNDTKKFLTQIERGKYLVTIGSCNDCHSPKIFGPQGPEPDTTKLLSGAPGNAKLPAVPAGVIAPDKWGAIGSNDLTTWVGPWGISFARNLTPDIATGIGSWTEQIFIKALRTGKHMGEGRNILPPMPWQLIGKATDNDLKAIFAYLKSLKPIENAVPEPIPPVAQQTPDKK
jgi:hypothetical protein